MPPFATTAVPTLPPMARSAPMTGIIPLTSVVSRPKKSDTTVTASEVSDKRLPTMAHEPHSSTVFASASEPIDPRTVDSKAASTKMPRSRANRRRAPPMSAPKISPILPINHPKPVTSRTAEFTSPISSEKMPSGSRSATSLGMASVKDE